jgi:glycosyltransferase involved in cell wall biosynthesis
MTKVALVGIYYPMAMLRYFERALQRRDDIELTTIGPYTGNWIPWNGGMQVQPKYAKPPTISLPQSMIGLKKMPANMLKQYDLDIDLWLEVDAGFYLDPKPEKGIVAHVATDPHALNYDRQRQLADYFFNMQQVYAKEGDIYLPYAYDPTVHYPEDLAIEYDVCMIGLHYEQRTQLVNRLLAEGLRVHYSIGEVFDEYRQIYNKSLVGINWSSKLDLNARVFELAAMGVCAVQNTVPDMKTFFVPGDHYLEFRDLDGAVEQVMYAVNNPDDRERIANAAMRKVQHHTYDARVQQILETVGLA